MEIYLLKCDFSILVGKGRGYIAPNLSVLSSKSGSLDCFLGFSVPEKAFRALKKCFSSGYGNRNYLLNFGFSILVGKFLILKIRIPPGGILFGVSERIMRQPDQVS